MDGPGWGAPARTSGWAPGPAARGGHSAPPGGLSPASGALGGSSRGGGGALGSSALGTALGSRTVADLLRRLLLELGPEEGRRQRASELLHRSSEQDASECIPLILDRIVNVASAHGLGIHALCELLRVHPIVMVQRLTAERVYDLFHPNADDRPALAFLHSFMCYKHSQGLGVEQESAKLQKLLIRRSKHPELWRAEASPLRAWLCKIWLDVPSSRPDRQNMASSCNRWIADMHAGVEEKLPCLALMKQELELRGRPEGEAWLLGNLLEQVCRDPISHSPDLQHLLWLLGVPPSPVALKPLLKGLAQERGRLATLWVCLSLWAPQPQPQDGITPRWPVASSPPIHALLNSMLKVFTQLAGADDLCRTSVLTLGAIAASGPGAVAASAAELLLLLHKEGPMLPSNVWLPLVPLLEHTLAARWPAAAELLARLRQRGGSGPLAQFATAPPSGGGGGAGGFGQPFPQAGGFPYGQHGGLQGGSSFPQQQHQMQGGFQQGSQYTQQLASGGFPQQNQALSQFASAPALNGHSYPQQPMRRLADMPGGLGPHNAIEIQFEPPRVGLQNTNNTCYMNSFIQSLFMTNHFVWRIFDFQLHLKKNPSKVDKEDFKLGLKVVELLKRQMAKMAITKHKHTDIWDLLQGFPAEYRNGDQQDVTETIRFVFDKLGSFEQPLIREVFAGELNEKVQCQVCKSVKNRPETFSDLVLSVPKADQVVKAGVVPTTQALLDQRLYFELMDENELVDCDTCRKKQRAGKWCEIVSPPAHLCICLNRFSFDVKALAMTKEKTPVRVDGAVQIGPFTYVLYFVIVHTGKDATSGHYYAIGHRSEAGPGQGDWVTMDDSQLKPADMSLLQGAVGDKQKDDNPYVLFYRCQEAPLTPPVRIPTQLAEEVRKVDEARVES